jgi:hypothetical protein
MYEAAMITARIFQLRGVSRNFFLSMLLLAFCRLYYKKLLKRQCHEMNCLGVQASPGPTVISSFIYCLSNTVGGSKKEYKKYSISKRLKNTEKNKEISEFQIQIEV